MTLYKNIRTRREELGLTQDDLAEMLGYKSRSTIAKIESGENDLVLTKVIAFAEALQTSPSYLMGWTDDPTPKPAYNLPDNLADVVRTRVLPILGEIACGDPVLAEQNFDGYFAVDQKIKADFCLKIKGDSMIGDSIDPGDIAFIKQTRTVENGQIAAVLYDGEATLKRVYITNEGYVLQPSNPLYSPVLIKNDIVILGKLVGLYKKIR